MCPECSTSTEYGPVDGGHTGYGLIVADAVSDEPLPDLPSEY